MTTPPSAGTPSRRPDDGSPDDREGTLHPDAAGAGAREATDAGTEGDRPPLGSDPTPLPRINPLKVGFVLATIQFAATIWFLGRCGGG